MEAISTVNREGSLEGIILTLLELFLHKCVCLFYRFKFLKLYALKSVFRKDAGFRSFWGSLHCGVTLRLAIKPADTLQPYEKAKVNYKDCLPSALG